MADSSDSYDPGDLSPIIRMATPVTLPTISACEGYSKRRTSWCECG